MTSSGETVLVTGAAGFIGSHLVERLLARGDTVVGLDNFDPFYSPEEKRENLTAALRNPRFTLVEADCSEPRTLESLDHAKFDVVVHLAAKAGIRPSLLDPVGYQRANVVGTAALLEFARQRKIGRFVFGSSSSVYGNAASVPFSEDAVLDRPISPYAATKRAGELLCYTYHHLYGTTILALRFFTVYGPRQRPDLAIRKFATQMLRGEEITLFGDGTTERDYTWVDDIIQGTVAAIDRTREAAGEFDVINLGESRTTSLRRLVEIVAGAVGVEPRIVRRPMQPGDVVRTYADVSKARDLLGYAPGTLVDEGIPRFVAWLREHEERGRRTPARS